jgi:MFS family permease
VGIAAEIPSGALADRFSRRGALVAAGVLQAGGYGLWITLPGFPAFAAGFVLWGLGGALVSGALEALLYEGLAAVGAEEHYPRALGQVTAVGLLGQLPTALAATVLFSLGGYQLAGWVSVGCCLAASALASRLPEPPREEEADGAAESETYLRTLGAALSEAAGQPAVRAAVLAVALLTGLDAIDEYFPLLARDWGVPTALNPVAILGIPLAGAAGAALGGSASRLGPWALTLMLGAAALALGGAGLLGHPVGLAAVALFYGLYRLVLVVVGARLQQRIEGTARATVTSVAAVGTELATFGLYAAWALGGVVVVAALLSVVAASLPRLLRVPARSDGPG